MRVVVAILLSLFFIGGTWAYTRFADSVRPEPVVIQAKLDEAAWRIVVTRTFDCVPDPDNDIAALSVRFVGQEVFQTDETIAINTGIEIKDLPSVQQGRNEIYLIANLARLDDYDFDTEQTRAIRVQLFRGYELLKDATLWSEPGATSIEEAVLFEAPMENSVPDHQHE